MARKLTDMQRAFVKEVIGGRTPTAACRAVGYSAPAVAAHALMRTPHVREHIQQEREARITGDLGTIALNTMRDLMTDAPANVRYSAARWVLEAGGLGGSDAQGGALDAKPLDQMDAEELRAAVSAGMGALQELAGQLDGHHIIEGTARAVRDITPADDLEFLS